MKINPLQLQLIAVLSFILSIFLLFQLQSQETYTSNKKERIYICITGQFPRLELSNKIEKVIKPLSKLGYVMNVGLSLRVFTPGSPAYFSNHNETKDRMQLIPTVRQAFNELLRVKDVEEARHFSPQHPGYLRLYRKRRAGNLMAEDNDYTRSVNYARQYQMLQKCNEWIPRDAVFAVRIREDALIKDINFSEVISLTLNGNLVTPSCTSNAHSINDKIAFFPASMAEKYFKLPFEGYDRGQKLFKNKMPSRHYYDVYKAHGLKMATSNIPVSKVFTERDPENIKYCHVRNFVNSTSSCVNEEFYNEKLPCWNPM